MKDPFKFTIEKKLSGTLGTLARAGILETPHGSIETPAFVVVGTKATVKALTPEQVIGLGAQVVLANTYHLYLEPGEEALKEAGGLSKYMNWQGPTMTDSGGFQVFSLGSDFGKKIGKIGSANIERSEVLKNTRISDNAEEIEAIMPLAKIDEEGVTFKSVIDGSSHRFTPESSIEIQHAIGADIIFAFDECTSPESSYEYQKEALGRTHRWATRSLEKHIQLSANSHLARTNQSPLGTGGELADMKMQWLFGIVQGGRFEDLRKDSARVISKMEFEGFGIGGSFEKEDMGKAVRWVNTILPEEKPRHLLGIGSPEDLFLAVENGCDLFDCVAPTRLARNGALYTKYGRINILNSKYKSDFTPIDEACACYACRNYTRCYIAHLFRANELLANTLASIHNLYFIVNLVKEMRKRIIDGTFLKFKDNFISGYSPKG